MANKKLIKAFVAGMAFPGVFLPLAYTVLFFMNHPPPPVQFAPMYIQLAFGVANVLFNSMKEGSAQAKLNAGLWVTGISLGFVVAVIGVFILKFPILIFHITDPGLQLFPLIALPIIYGLIFRYIVKWLNKILAV